MKLPDIQEWDKKKLLQQGDVVKFRILGHPITINEIHAFQMGFVGLFVGLAYSAGLTTEASLVAMALVSYAILGDPIFHSLDHENPKYKKSIGMKTIKHEPWYFIIPFVATFLVGMLYLPTVI